MGKGLLLQVSARKAVKLMSFSNQQAYQSIKVNSQFGKYLLIKFKTIK
jgi:hypothetical protein